MTTNNRRTKRSAEAVPTSTEGIRAHLESLEKKDLTALILQQAEHDEGLKQRLILQVASARGDATQGVAAYKQAITAAFRIRAFVDYRGARAYASRITGALRPVEQLIATADASLAIELTEHALTCLERSVGRVDDSDGHTGEIREWLHDMHFAACDKSRPEPKALARRLFARELMSELDVFHRSAERYANILGPHGIAVYRALASVEWAKVPVVPAGANNPNRYGTRFRITKMMESLAIASGDVDELVSVLKHDLSHEIDFVHIVEVYEQANKFDLALEWAERGVAAYAAKTDHRLLEILARQYVRAKRDDDALNLMWRVFRERITLENYQKLHAFAHPMQRWPEWRTNAMSVIIGARDKQMSDALPNVRASISSHFGSLLVEILLWEQTPELAWAQALESGCRRGLWMHMAAQREVEHPNDAARVYMDEVEEVLQHADKRAYRDGVSALKQVRRAMLRAGREADFGDYLAGVRRANKLRKSFLLMLEKERL